MMMLSKIIDEVSNPAITNRKILVVRTVVQTEVKATDLNHNQSA